MENTTFPAVFNGEINHKSQVLCNARELHEFLKSKQDFSTWIKNRIKKYGFLENQDFCSFDNFVKRETGGSVRIEYHITLDMAKELAMVENNAMGRQ
ncbi:MAG: antA/AntB antirepressor family protein, partial [Neisseriaceae bacterium]|nr:antA/AntB antirepressor family protein [Neisseriaceae bacterium]